MRSQWLRGRRGGVVVILGRDEPTPTVSPFLLLPLPISADHDTCSVKHTPCGNGVTSQLYCINTMFLSSPTGPSALRSDRQQFASGSVTELMTSDLSNAAINACYLENKMIQFVFFSGWVMGAAHH